MPKAPKSKAPKAPADPTKPSTRDIAKVVNFYLHNVRMHDKQEYVGIFRQIQLLVKKGVTLADISQAAQNYSKNDFVKNSPQQSRHHIRRFFMLERIKQWAAHVDTTIKDKSLAALHKLTEAAMAGEVVPTEPVAAPGPWKADEEEEEQPFEL